MKRTLYQDLVRWKNKQNHKPLILFGARQVGKTWLMKTFGKSEYSKVAYFNFETTPSIAFLFID